MPAFSIAPANVEDDTDILALQNANHVSVLPPETLADGFVTTQLSLDSLARMRANGGIWVARSSDGTLAGYACANDWDFYGEGPFQSAAKALLPGEVTEWDIKADDSFQYGPVCLNHSFRGQGVLDLLVEAIKTHYAPRFAFGITFIDVRNARSLAAHERKMGFRRIALLPFSTVTYHMLAFPTHL